MVYIKISKACIFKLGTERTNYTEENILMIACQDNRNRNERTALKLQNKENRYLDRSLKKIQNFASIQLES